MQGMPEVNNDFDNLGTGIIVVDKNHRFLLGKRLGNAYLSGKYGIPGGRVKRGESLVESAKRELLEETGLEARKIEFIGLVNDNQRKRTFLHVVFVCKSFSGTLQTLEPEKCEEWKWFDADNLPDDILPGHRAGINMFREKRGLIELL